MNNENCINANLWLMLIVSKSMLNAYCCKVRRVWSDNHSINNLLAAEFWCIELIEILLSRFSYKRFVEIQSKRVLKPSNVLYQAVMQTQLAFDRIRVQAIMMDRVQVTGPRIFSLFIICIKGYFIIYT